MSKKIKILLTIIGIIVILVAGFLIAPFFINKEIQEELNLNKEFNSKIKTTDALQFTGYFEKVDYAVEGGFKLYEADNKKILRIENLDITNGPDLYLVLSNKKPSFGNNEYKIIEPLKANRGNFNVELKSGIDFSKYKYLLIHCKTFSHTFAAAKISQK